jgi:RimJ/RimL family protein N-acetyltransferase
MMDGFQFERTHDMALAREILTHPRIYPHITDDGCPVAERFIPPDDPRVWYLLVRRNGQCVGLFALHPQNAICYEVHTCLLPCCWGPQAVELAVAAREWIWRNTPARRLVTNVPTYNQLALRFALKAGMALYGCNPASFLKNGKLYAQHMLGVSKEDY